MDEWDHVAKPVRWVVMNADWSGQGPMGDMMKDLKPGRPRSNWWNAGTQRERRSYKPAVAELEDRKLMTIQGVWGYAAPQKLVPNGKYVSVLVAGEVVTDQLNQKPTVRYQVTDQYAQVQPGGFVKLQMKKPGDYIFSFVVKLQARHSSTFQSARLYAITLGYEDADNGAGKTIPVIVPKYYKPPGGPKLAASRVGGASKPA